MVESGGCAEVLKVGGCLRYASSTFNAHFIAQESKPPVYNISALGICSLFP